METKTIVILTEEEFRIKIREALIPAIRDSLVHFVFRGMPYTKVLMHGVDECPIDVLIKECGALVSDVMSDTNPEAAGCYVKTNNIGLVPL